jgi:hypothetical protein
MEIATKTKEEGFGAPAIKQVERYNLKKGYIVLF